MKALGIVTATIGILTLFLFSALTYSAAHGRAQAFLAAHPELQNVSFTVIEVPLKSGGTGRLIMDGRSGQPTNGQYVLEFDKLGVLETTKQDAVAKTVSGGYLDVTHIPSWEVLISMAIIVVGLILGIRGYKSPTKTL